MTCKSCAHQFCWLCLTNWINHPSSSEKCKDLANTIELSHKIDIKKSDEENKLLEIKNMEKYTEKVIKIERKRSMIKEILGKTVVFNKKNMIRVENFRNFFFELEKDLAFVNEYMYINNDNRIQHIQKALDRNLMFFTNK